MKTKITVKKITLTLTVAIAIILCVLVLLYWNQLILNGMIIDTLSEMNALDIGHTEIESAYGKLNGNGNGINYFVAILIQTDDPAEIERLVAVLEEKYDDAGYYKQEKNKIESKYLEHRDLYFFNYATRGYVVWFYESSHPLSNPIDPNGH